MDWINRKKKQGLKRAFSLCMVALLLLCLIPAMAAAADAWAPNTSYHAGDVVTYGGSTYACLQPHTSLTGWEPPNVPALWSLQTGGTPTPTATPTPTPTPTVTPTATPTPTPTATPTATPTPTPTATPNGCTDPAWNVSTAYSGGARVSYNGKVYQAKWWTQGDQPDTHSGQYDVWSYVADCGGGGTDTQAPTAPSNLISTGKTSGSVSLSWGASTDNVGVTGYNVYNGSSLATTVSGTSATVSGLSAGTAYTFTVKAKDGAGNLSAASNSVNVTTDGGVPDTQAPTAPTNLISTGKTSGSVSLSWGASTDNVGVTGYNVYNGSSLATTVSGTSATVSGLAAETAYTFTVKAKDGAGNLSAASSPVNVTTLPSSGGGDIPDKILDGYWHNFENGSGFIPLRNVSANWDVINVSFAEPTSGSTNGTMGFTPYNYTDAQFIADVDYLHGLGKKVLISIGGANGQVSLDTTAAKNNFVNSMISIIETYHFDGMDIDFEGHSVHLNAGDTDFKNPTTPVIVNTISAIRTIHDHFGDDFILTMAPETFFVQLGYSFYGGSCISCDNRAGAFLPVIYGVRDILNWLQVQDYNSGPITGLDNQYHNMGSADFHIAMLDMLLSGFPIANANHDFFPALRPDQVVLGLPASGNAGNGYTSPSDVQSALNYLIKGTPYGSYQIHSNPANNESFRGIMAWSVNWDAFANYQFTNSLRSYLDGLE